MPLLLLAAVAAFLSLALAPGAGALDIDQDTKPADAEVGTPYSFQLIRARKTLVLVVAA